MSLRRNILANYACQIYVTAIGIIMVPLYIKYMGAEAYGLVGFFSMLQAWFNLLDMGLTPTISRESARFHGGAISVQEYRRLVRALEGLFGITALLGATVLFFMAEPIAAHWLNTHSLPDNQAIVSLRLMAFIVALRWMSGFYRGVITGAEKLVWLSGINSLVATGRFVLVLPVLILLTSTPWAFFSFQLVVAVLELGSLAWMAYRILPATSPGQRLRWEWEPVKPVLKFSLSIAFTSSVWVLVTQIDKLVLSKILPLADYGYFTVAVLLASGIMMASGPISSALMPRMARCQAEGLHEQLVAVYRQGTHLVSIVAVPTALILAFLATQVLWAWTGNQVLVEKAAPALSLYAIGYGFLALGAFPYYLQYAKGDLKLHLLGNILFIVLLVPAVIWAASHYGMTGAGWAWLAANVLYFFAWTPLVHRRFIPGLHLRWLLIDIALPVLPAVFLAVLATQCIPWSQQRGVLMIELVLAGAILLSVMFLLVKFVNYQKKRGYFAS